MSFETAPISIITETRMSGPAATPFDPAWLAAAAPRGTAAADVSTELLLSLGGCLDSGLD